MRTTKLSVTTLNPSTFSEFRIWNVPTPEDRRILLVSQALPCPSDYVYGVICTSGTIRAYGEPETDFEDLNELFSTLNYDKNWRELEKIKKQYILEEGETALPPDLAQALVDAAKPAESAWVYCDYNPNLYVWEVPLKSYLYSESLLSVLPNVFGEFQIAPTRGLPWFMYIRDDDPLIFFTASRNLMEQLVTNSPELVMEVPGEMRYI
jgi:hypothetical protein